MPYLSKARKCLFILHRTQESLSMGSKWYATPVLQTDPWSPLKVPKEVMSHLCSCEKRLLQNPRQAETYRREMGVSRSCHLLKQLMVCSPVVLVHTQSHCWWQRLHRVWLFLFLPKSVPELPAAPRTNPWDPPPWSFRQQDCHQWRHQINVPSGAPATPPQLKPLLCFLWRDLDCRFPPMVYEWQVLICWVIAGSFTASRGSWRMHKDADGGITHSIHNFYYFQKKPRDSFEACTHPSTLVAFIFHQLLDGLTSTLFLYWLLSDLCRYKVFVGVCLLLWVYNCLTIGYNNASSNTSLTLTSCFYLFMLRGLGDAL